VDRSRCPLSGSRGRVRARPRRDLASAARRDESRLAVVSGLAACPTKRIGANGIAFDTTGNLYVVVADSGRVMQTAAVGC
jgi:hypothetical protein